MTGSLDNIEGAAVGAPVHADAGAAPKAVTRHPSLNVGPNAGRTAARVESIKQLVAEFAVRSLGVSDIAAMLKMSASGARAYIRDMRDGGVIVLTDSGMFEPNVYCINPDPAQVATFLAEIDAKPVFKRTPRPSLLHKAMRDPTRHFHFTRDDEHISVKVRRAPVAADPLALDRDFFRPSSDSIPAPVRTQAAAAPQTTGFAALDVHFVRRAPDQAKAKESKARQAARRQAGAIEAVRLECKEMAGFFGQLAGAMA